MRLDDGHVYNRTLQHLYPLEIQEHLIEKDDENESSDSIEPRRNPPRSAAINARDKIRSINSNVGGEDVRNTIT